MRQEEKKRGTEFFILMSLTRRGREDGKARSGRTPIIC